MTTFKNIPALRFKEFGDKWMVIKLEDVTEKIQDGTHFSPIQKEQGNYKYITSKNIRNGFMDLKDVMFLDDEAHREIYKRCDVKYNDILLTKDGASTGAVCLNKLHEEFSLLSSVAFLRANKKLAINAFLFQIIAGPRGQQEIQESIAGQAITRITLSKIRNFKFYFPSLPEQQKIASFLSAIDQKIQQLTRKKELLEQYKKGVMQQLFSGKLRFKDENGKAYPKWEEKTLFDISENVSYGMNAAATEFDGFHKYLRITDIVSGKFKPNPLTSPAGQIDEKFKLMENDIVFARTGASVGKSYLYNPSDGNLYYAGFLIKFSITNANSYFVYSLTLRDEYDKWVHVYSMRSGQPGLNAEEYKALKLKMPSLPEQQKIGDFLYWIDIKIEGVDAQITQTQTFKKGLLQQMFV